jgi:hypothetical protein
MAAPLAAAVADVPGRRPAFEVVRVVAADGGDHGVVDGEADHRIARAAWGGPVASDRTASSRVSFQATTASAGSRPPRRSPSPRRRGSD